MTALRRYLLFLILSLAAFAPIINAPYVYDDVVVVQNNAFLKDWEGLQRILGGHVDSARDMDGTYRPVFLTFLSLVGRTCDFHPAVFRLVSLLLHALNGVLLFAVLTGVLALGSRAALAVCLCFLLHPIQSSAIALVWKQSDVWIGLLSLASLLQMSRSSRPAASVWAFLLFILAIGFKESALALPLMWLAVEPLVSPHLRPARLGAIAAAVAVGAGAYLFLLPHVPQPALSQPNPAGPLANFFTQLTVLPLYAKAYIMPSLLTIDRGVALAVASPFRDVAAVSIASTIVLALAVFAIRRNRPAAASLLAIACLVPTSSFRPLSLLYDETRVYLAAPFVLAAIAAAVEPLIDSLSLSARTTRLALRALGFFLIALSIVSGFRWTSERRLWSDALDVDSRSSRAHYQLGVLAQDERALEEAAEHYRLALEISPDLHSARLNLGIVRGRMGDLPGAAEEFEHLLGAPARWAALGHYHLGIDAQYRGQTDEALDRMKEVRRVSPHSGLADKGEAAVLELAGLREEAAKALGAYLRTPGLSGENLRWAHKKLQAMEPVGP